MLDVPGWSGHVAGQNVDVRLTAEDGYQAERSYAIASAPESAKVALTVERIDDGEVSSHLTGALRVADELELRGPIGGPFTWRIDDGGPLLLVADGSGLVPLMAMLRHRAAKSSTVDARLLISTGSPAEVLYRSELMRLAANGESIRSTIGGTRLRPRGKANCPPPIRTPTGSLAGRWAAGVGWFGLCRRRGWLSKRGPTCSRVLGRFRGAGTVYSARARSALSFHHRRRQECGR